VVFRKVAPLALALAFIGYLAPWVNHRAAALVLSGQDMGEFVKFLPEVRAESVVMVRHFFYLPPFTVAIGLALSGGNRHLAYPWPLRTLMLLAVFPVSLTLLPPVWTPAVLTSSEFLLQFLAFLFCLVLAAGFWLVGRMPVSLVQAILGVLSPVAASLALWQFFTIRPAIDRVYGHPIEIGWGVALTALGLLAVSCLALPVADHR
jgi:hypothetical protein